MVIASSYLGDAKSEDGDLITRFRNWFFTKTINFLHDGKYTDVMVMFRAIKKYMIYELEVDKEDSYALPEKLFFTNLSREPLLSTRAAKVKKMCLKSQVMSLKELVVRENYNQ